MIRILIPLVLCLPLAAADPHMTDTERTKLLDWLEESRKEFLAAIDGVSDAQWKWKPAPEKWSVGEVAEHVVLAEADLFGNFRKAMAAPAGASWEKMTASKTAMIEYAMAPRLGRVQAPEKLVPGGKLTMTEVKERFERQRVEIARFARDTKDPVKEHVWAHPFPIFDPLNGYQWLIYIPLHTMRHDKQIAEVKATAGYPGK